MRIIGVMIGSDSDLPQCIKGLEYLQGAERNKEAMTHVVITNSIHRNTGTTLENIRIFSNQVDVWIIGAGMANHLTGVCEAYLRYALGDRTPVIGVAFESTKNPRGTEAAILSITELPEKRVIFKNFVGEEGFLRACVSAVNDDLPEIDLPKSKAVSYRNLNLALDAARKKRGAK